MEVIEAYIHAYLRGADEAVSRLSPEMRRSLHDRFVAHQEVLVYRVRGQFVGIEFRGISPTTTIEFRKSHSSLAEIILPQTDLPVDRSKTSLRLKPLFKASQDQLWLPRLCIAGDPQEVSLLDLLDNAQLLDFEIGKTQGRYALENLFLRRKSLSGKSSVRFISYFEAVPKRSWALKSDVGKVNALHDLNEEINLINKLGLHTRTKSFIRSGEALIKAKERGVIVLGTEEGIGRDRLLRIKAELKVLGYQPFLAREEDEVPFMSLEEKVKGLLHLSRFAVMEDTEPGGQIAEYEYCREGRHILVVLREKDQGSTWMTADAHLADVNYIRLLEYSSENLGEVLKDACLWAESFLERRGLEYDKHYPWRVATR